MYKFYDLGVLYISLYISSTIYTHCIYTIATAIMILFDQYFIGGNSDYAKLNSF